MRHVVNADHARASDEAADALSVQAESRRPLAPLRHEPRRVDQAILGPPGLQRRGLRSRRRGRAEPLQLRLDLRATTAKPRSTSAGTPAMSAIPLLIRVHRTPSDRVSSDRSRAS
jgi:hypothetical protein